MFPIAKLSLESAQTTIILSAALFTALLLLVSSNGENPGAVVVLGASVILTALGIRSTVPYKLATVPSRGIVALRSARAAGTWGAALVFLCIVSAPVLSAADFSTYRGFKLGNSLGSTLRRTGVNQSDLRLIHKRPALIQELDWRPTVVWSASGSQQEAVSGAVLRFCDGALFEIIASYDFQRVEGLSPADMVGALSRTYGQPETPNVEIPFRSSYGEKARVLARWQDGEYTADLIRTGDQTSFALVLSSDRLASVARAAVVEATRLDLIEAPQREIDGRLQKDTDERLALEKARSVNLPNFRP